jgi:tetratricopeptide (TPR) repeat protein
VPRARRLVFALVAMLAVASSTGRVVAAQGRNWSDLYATGVAAIKKQQWADAIASLTKAIAVDARSQANKHIEGTYYEDYFPFYYRGLAYMQAGDAQKAEADFQTALKTKMPDALAQDLKRREAQVEAILASPNNTKASAPPPPAVAPKPEPARTEAPPAAPAGPDPSVQAAGLVKEGNAFLAQGRLADAQTSFQSALKVSSQAPGAQDGLSSVTTRRTKSTTALANGRDLAQKSQFAAADAKYQEAIDADPANGAAADALRKSQTFGTRVSDGRSMFSQSNWLGARVQFIDAQSLDPERFKAEGLDATLAEIGRRLAPKTAAAPAGSPATPATPAPVARPPLHDALVAYLQGDPKRAIDLLQPIASNDTAFDAAGRASVHAYLGAAYATSALASRAEADRATWRQKAVREFQLAEAAEPGFQLSERVVSPAIQDIIKEARRK